MKEGKSFSAFCPEVDVATEGKNIPEAKDNLIEAVSLYVESAIESNLPILRTMPEEENLLISKPKDIEETFRLQIELEIHAHAWTSGCQTDQGC